MRKILFNWSCKYIINGNFEILMTHWIRVTRLNVVLYVMWDSATLKLASYYVVVNYPELSCIEACIIRKIETLLCFTFETNPRVLWSEISYRLPVLYMGWLSSLGILSPVSMRYKGGGFSRKHVTCPSKKYSNRSSE